MIEKRYRSQKTRGKQGFGFVSLNNGDIMNHWRAEGEERILKEMREQKCDEILFHHRMPTSTPNLWECAHPIKVDHECLNHNYYVIHNGVISNADKLKEGHDKLGFKYTTEISQNWLTKEGNFYHTDKKFNDSESLAIELARDIDIDGLGVPGVNGSIAFIVLQTTKFTKKATRLFWGKNFGSPLKFQRNEIYMSLTSEGHGQDVKEHELNCYDYATGKITTRSYQVGVKYFASESSYSHGDSGWRGGPKPWEKDAEERAVVPISPILPKRIGFMQTVEDDIDELGRLFPTKEGQEPIDLTKLPIIGAGISKEEMENDMYELMDAEKELETINNTVSKGGHSDSMQEYFLERKHDLESTITALHKKYYGDAVLNPT